MRRKKAIGQKCVLWPYLQRLSETFLIIRIIQRDISKLYKRLQPVMTYGAEYWTLNKDIANGWLLLKERFEEECLDELK